MKDCVRYAPMIGAREGELSAAEAEALALHLEACDACAARAADLAVTEGLVSEALLARAAARDFAPFVDQVMARVETEAARAPGRGRRDAGAQPAGGVLSWLHAHWRATAATLAPALAAAAVFMYVRSGSGPEVALLELSTEGNVATVLETSYGPVVLLAPEESGS